MTAWLVYRSDGYASDGVFYHHEGTAYAVAQENADVTGWTYLVDDGKGEPVPVEPSRRWPE